MTDTEAHSFASFVSASETGNNDTVKTMALSIVDQLRPTTALDLGCGIDLLAGELRTLGVDVREIDTPEEAVTSDLDGDFDLIICVEVLQRLSDLDGRAVIATMCNHGRTILFSSSPDRFDDMGSINVQPSDYWIGLFAERSFFRNLDHDASYVSADAVIFEHRAGTMADLARAYERAWWQAHRAAQGARLTHERLTDAAHAATVALEAAGSERQNLTDELAATMARLESMSADRDRLSSLLVVERAMFESRLASAGEAASELTALMNTKIMRYSSALRRAYGLTCGVLQKLSRP